MRPTDIYIAGVGVYLPETMPVADAVELGLYPREEAEKQQLTGVAIAGDTPAPEMALAAAQEALKRRAGPADPIGLLLYVDVWHQGPDGWSPQYYLQRNLIGGDSLAVEIHQGCNGVFGALELASAYLQVDPRGRDALIVAADNFGTDRIDRWRSGPNFVLADGASALVLTREPSFAQLMSVNSVALPEAEELHRRGDPLFPPDATTGRPVDFAARADRFVQWTMSRISLATMWVTMHERLVGVMRRTLEEAGITTDDVTRVAFTNMGREAVEERCVGALNLPMSRSTWEYGRTIGHVGASDQFLAFDHLLVTGELEPGDHLLMVSLGPGVTASCAVVKIRSTPAWVV